MTDVLRALRAADDMPHGAARIAVVTDLLEQVDEDELHDVEAYTLICLVEATRFGGSTSQTIVASSRLRRLWDEHPDRFDETDQRLLHTAVRWAVERTLDDPAVPAATVEALLADMRELYAIRGGLERQMAATELTWAARSERSEAEVDEAVRAWMTTSVENAECSYCRLTRRVSFAMRTRDYAKALEIAASEEEGTNACWREPSDLYSMVALATFELGDNEASVNSYLRLESAIRRSKSPATIEHARRIALLGRGGAVDLAVAAIEDQQHQFTADVGAAELLYTLTWAAAGVHALRVEHGDRAVNLHTVPASTITELADWLTARALEVADRFDARVGTTSAHERALANITAPVTSPPFDLTVNLTAPPVFIPTEAASVTAEPASVPAETASSQPAWQRALDAADKADNPRERAAWLQQGVDAALEDGALSEAGFASAELGVLLLSLQNHAAAESAFKRALDLLEASGTDPALIVPVVVEWAPLSVSSGSAETVDNALERMREALGLQRFDEGFDDDLRVKMERVRDKAAASADDTRARLLGSLADAEALTLASDLATRAADTYLALMLNRDAVDARWLAGRLHVERGDLVAAAVALKDAALLAGRDRHRDRGEIAAEAIDVLTRLGDDAGAAAVRDGIIQ